MSNRIAWFNAWISTALWYVDICLFFISLELKITLYIAFAYLYISDQFEMNICKKKKKKKKVCHKLNI